MKFYAYRLTGDPEADTRALRAWGLGVTVTNDNGESSVEINNPSRWVTGCLGYRWIARAGSLVVFSPDKPGTMSIKIADEVTSDDTPKNRTKR